MCEAQREFDAKAMPLCPAHLTSPVLHRVLAYQPVQQHVWGGKGVGSQASAGKGKCSFGCARLVMT
jgi:galactokinase